jgi:hypothetical protein
MNKEIAQLVRLVQSTPGWTVEQRRSCHYMVKPPSGEPIFMAGTPSDKRAIKNARAHLKRAGLAI